MTWLKKRERRSAVLAANVTPALADAVRDWARTATKEHGVSVTTSDAVQALIKNGLGGTMRQRAVQQEILHQAEREVAAASRGRRIEMDSHRGPARLYVAKMTKPLAALLLERCPEGQRALRVPRVRAMKTDMGAGRFEDIGHVVVLSRDGVLLDGQHRLSAFLESDVAWDAVVQVVPGEDMAGLDQGSARTMKDRLVAANVTAYSGAVSSAVALEASDFTTAWTRMSARERFDLVASIDPEHGRVLERLRTHGSRNKVRMPGPVLAVALRALKTGRGVEFFEAVAANNQLLVKPPGPVRCLATWLMSTKSHGGGQFQRETVVRTIYAYNAHLEGRDIQLIRYYAEAPVPAVKGPS